MGVVGEKRNECATISGDGAPTGTVIVSDAVNGTKGKDGGTVRLRLFVGGLGPTVSKSDVQQRFAPLGSVHQIQIVEGKSGEEGQLRFAYVEFEASSEASLRKLFSAYNGCKWKGGSLRVEKAKEHYLDRLRREWAEEAAKIAETEMHPQISSTISGNSTDKHIKGLSTSSALFSMTEPLKIPIPFSKKVRLVPPKGTGRHKRSFQYFPSLSVGELTREYSPPRSSKVRKLAHSKGVLQVSGSVGVELVDEDQEQDGDEEVDEIGIEIARERNKQLLLLTRLFPDEDVSFREKDKETVQDPMAIELETEDTLVMASDRPQCSQDTLPVNDVQAPKISIATNLELSFHEQEVSDKDAKESNLRVKFYADADDRTAVKKNVMKKMLPKVDVNGAVRSILKKVNGIVVADQDKELLDEEAGEEESPMEEDYYTSSRSPSPVGGLSETGKWERLFKYATVTRGSKSGKASDRVFSGILDDLEEESTIVPMTGTRESSLLSTRFQKTSGTACNDSIFSGMLDEPEEKPLPAAKVTNHEDVHEKIAKKKKKKKGNVATTKVSADELGAASVQNTSILENRDSPSGGVHDKAESEDISMEEDLSELSSDHKDFGKDLEAGEDDVSEDLGTGSDPEEVLATDELFGAGTDIGSSSPIALTKEAKVSKWEEMFRTANNMEETHAGSLGPIFSGALDELEVEDVILKTRFNVPTERMFELAAVVEREGPDKAAPNVKKLYAEREHNHVDGPTVLMQSKTSAENEGEKANTVEEEVYEKEKEEKEEDNDDEVGGEGEDEGELKARDNTGGNLLARFEREHVERDPSQISKPQPSDSSQSNASDEEDDEEGNKEEDFRPGTSDPEQNAIGEVLAESSPTSVNPLDEKKEFDEHSNWVQRASWKSLVGGDGRIAFSLKSITGDLKPKKLVSEKKSPHDTEVPKEPFTFSFSFDRMDNEASKPASSQNVVPKSDGEGNMMGRPRLSKSIRDLKEDNLGIEEKDCNKVESVPTGVEGCLFMKSSTAEKDWKLSKNEIRMDSKAKHKSAVRTMKKLRSSGGPRY